MTDFEEGKKAQRQFLKDMLSQRNQHPERMADIVRKIGRITRYETKQYIGASRILDLEKSSPEVQPLLASDLASGPIQVRRAEEDGPLFAAARPSSPEIKVGAAAGDEKRR